MAYKIFDDYSNNSEKITDGGQQNKIILDSENGKQVDLPDSSYVTDADMSREGVDLVLDTSEGTVVVEGYFAIEPMPHLVAPDGTTLTPNLVQSFVHGDNEYADAGQSVNDASPVGAVQEISGEATVTRLDGTVETVGIGTPIYQGDVIETEESGAVNIMFIDQTSFAVSEDARLAIDEYVFDPATQSGTTNFSVLKGVFVFTSGLIGREDPDDVMINTPSGSIGIRGTIIAGDVDAGEITVIEGAIVLYDFSGNTLTLSNQYETAKFNTSENTIDIMGELEADDVASKFMSVSTVSADLFSSIQDSASETQQDNTPDTQDTNDDLGKEASTLDSENVIVTSDDIIGSGLGDALSDSNLALDNNSSNDGTDSTQISYSKAHIYEVVVDNTPETPFNITVTKLSFTENTFGQDVARVTGNFTSYTNLALLGTSSNYYDFVREDDNNFLISLKPGVSIDAEDPFNLFIAARNGSGAAVVTQLVDLNVINVDEPITYTGLATNISLIDNYFSGSRGTVLNYDISQEFFDPEGAITSYSFVGSPTHANLLSATLTNEGALNIILDNSASAIGSFNFTVHADTGGTFLDHTFTFDIYGNNLTTSSFIGSPNQTYHGSDNAIYIGTNNVNVFSDIDNSANHVIVGGMNAYVKTGGGDDTITILPSIAINYHAYGDLGNDTFKISEMQGKSYGGDGNDVFIIQTTSAMSQLQTLGSGVVLDGGSGNDTIMFNVAGSVDFGVITTGFIKQIETLNFDNGGANTIYLNYNDVINMTDDNNLLVINMDAMDTLNFTNSSSNSFVQAANTINNSGELYNVFTDGTITLLVDVEASAVAGII